MSAELVESSSIQGRVDSISSRPEGPKRCPISLHLTPEELQFEFFTAQPTEPTDGSFKIDPANVSDTARIISEFFRNVDSWQSFGSSNIRSNKAASTYPDEHPFSGTNEHNVSFLTQYPANTEFNVDPDEAGHQQPTTALMHAVSTATSPHLIRRTKNLSREDNVLNTIVHSQQKRKLSSCYNFVCSYPKRAQSKSFSSITTSSVRHHDSLLRDGSPASLLLSSPMPLALTGWSGRLEIDQACQYLLAKPVSTNHAFGYHYHPNGQITNTDFHVESSAATTSGKAGLTTMINDLESQYLTNSVSHISMPDAESEFRTEAHRECSMARLIGVPVGYYRYFAGHMTIEEYLAARMCICWEGCWCCQLCGRFGDLICPCSMKLVLEGSDSGSA